VGIGRKYDHPPLLPPGKHHMGLISIFKIAVEPFSNEGRERRQQLFDALSYLIDKLIEKDIPCDVVIDGSFLTKKTKPDDIDVKVYIDYDVSQSLSDEQDYFFVELNSSVLRERLDSTSFTLYPVGHPEKGSALDPLVNGEDYGVENSEQWRKGYVVVMVGETHVGLRLRR
jgi:hypothetical protein